VSVARCREINARLRAAGFKVHEYPGCWSRGNGQSPAYEGGIVHHTASAFGIATSGTGIGKLLADGRPDLSGPLCNWAGNVDGSFTFFAAFPANHAGASGGRSMGPLPVTRLFNPRVLGLEIVYPGTQPMRDAQYRSALVWSKTVTDVCGYSNLERVRAHAETSITGKWDPGYAPGRTINMGTFRKAATTLPEDDDMGNLDPNQTWWASGYKKAGTLGAWTREVRESQIRTEAMLAADKGVDTAALAEAVVARQRDLLTEVVREAVPDELADDVLARLGEKLTALTPSTSPEGN